VSDTDTLYGRVSAVFLRYAGSSLATAIAGGETTVQLEDVFDYNDAGGQALVFADDTPNAAEVLTYTGVDRDTAQLTGVTWATGGAHAAGAFVSNDPDGAAFDTWAVVSREGFDDGDMVARVPHRWQDAVGLAEGIYDQQSGVPVSCTFDGSQYVVTDVLGTQLAVDGSAIDGSTITGVTATVGTDGLTPDTPVVTLVEGPGWLQASWPLPNTTVDPLGFRVYIADGSDPTTVGSTNLVATTTALSAVISTLADGTTPLATADTYHVIVVAYSLLAGGGTSADSTAATGSPGVMDGNVTTITNLDAGKITTGTLAAARIAAGSITADRLAGTLTFSNVFQTSAPGTQRVVIDGTAVTGGIFLFDSSGNTLISLPLDPAMSATFKGNIQTGSITITGNLTIQGTTNIMDKGSQLTLNEKTGNANTPPTATLEYPTVALTGIPTGYTTVGGVNYDAAGGAGGATPVLYGLGFAAGSTKLMEFSASTGALLRSVDIGPGDDSGYGVTRAGTKIWVLELSGSGINSWVRVDQAAFTVDTTITASSLPNTGSSVTAIAFPPNGRGGLGVSYDGTHVLVAGWASATNGAAKTISRYDMSSGTPSHVDTQTLVNGTKLSTTSPRALTGLAYDGTNYWTVTSLFTSGGVPNGYIMEKYIVSTLTLSTGTGDTQNDRDFTQGQDSGLTNIPLGLGYDSANGIFYLGYGSSTGSTTSQVIKMTSWLPTGNLLWVAYAWKIADTVVDTVTISNASPAVITVATVSAHGLSANDEVFLTTTGTLPTGLSPNTPYYVQSAGLTTTAFRVAATKGGSSINTSSAGSGTHTLHKVIETLVSPQTSVNLTDSAANTAYRRRVRITTPTIPSGFDHSPV